jgi:hypothetical protein
MPQIPAFQDESFRASLRQFLRSKSEESHDPEYCGDCNSLLVNLELRVWLDGDETLWNIPLPFCVQCHPELATRVASTDA